MLKQTPIIVLIFVIVFAVGAIWILVRQLPLVPNRFVIWGVCAFVLLVTHRGRHDAVFCRLILLHPWRLFAIEYLVCLSPFVVISFMTHTWDNAAFYLILPVCVALLPVRTGRRVSGWSNILGLPHGKIPPFMGVRSLELVSFVRRRFVLLLLVSAAALVFSYVPVFSIIILLFLVVLMNDAYLENEPLDMLFLAEESAGKYLKHKVITGWILFMKLSAPALLMYVVFNPHTAHLVLFPPIVSLTGIALFVFVKYSRYDPDKQKVIVPLAAVLGITGIIIPPMLPLTLIMSWGYWGAAKKNLNKYLDVYDN